ncbi:DNA-binding protein [Ramlibacter monticola]|uniref:DNA-binding protein n=1 Tax=Ramlibacter monticola TaxID=1926872 RepID=A0A937CUJ8_9BURK|nr:DNA-binding protein [Ramlibacter monticola]
MTLDVADRWREAAWSRILNTPATSFDYEIAGALRVVPTQGTGARSRTCGGTLLNLRRKKRGRPGVTLAEVLRACEALKAQGRAVGPTNVRLELGRGSFNTIVRHLRALGYGRPAPRKDS